MNPNNPTPAQSANHALHLRYERLGLAIRCAYNPTWPPAIQLYLDAGQALVTAGLQPEPQQLRQSLRLLLQTANDQALPRPWRLACLTSVRLPLRQLQDHTCWPHAPGDVALMEAGLQADVHLLCGPAERRARQNLPAGKPDAL